jgi:acetyltransferase-like isoleucine patch superfamily enzyme
VTGRRPTLGKLARIPGLLRARFVLRSARLGSRVHVGGRLHVDNRGAVGIGDRVCFVGGIIPGELVCDPGAEMSIGADCIFNYGASLRASVGIRVGDRCLVGSMARIRDDDGATVAPVRIGDDVWIAHGAMVEPGVTIGDGAVVAAGSVVVSDVPERMLAMGNPARIVPLQVGPAHQAGSG